MELTIIQAIFLGIIQGITEWIPISSSAALVLIMSNIFKITDPGILIRAALFFHLGTFLAALIYFRKEVIKLLKTFFNYKNSNEEDKKILKFIIIATLISGVLGFLLVEFVISLRGFVDITGKTISFFIGILLFFTGIIQLKIKKNGLRKEKSIKNSDSILLGLFQALAVLPGLSRSGITISALLLRKFDDTSALRLSFLLSLPIVLAGNIILNLEDFVFTSVGLYGLLTSFIFGFLTISLLMRLSKKINFAWFVLIFAILMMLSIFI